MQLKIATILQVLHVGCNCHKLNLEVEHMLKIYKTLNERLVKFHETMLHCKQNLKDRTLLSNMTNRKPIIYNEIRWSGKYAIIDFCRESTNT